MSAVKNGQREVFAGSFWNGRERRLSVFYKQGADPAMVRRVVDRYRALRDLEFLDLVAVEHSAADLDRIFDWFNADDDDCGLTLVESTGGKVVELYRSGRYNTVLVGVQGLTVELEEALAERFGTAVHCFEGFPGEKQSAGGPAGRSGRGDQVDGVLAGPLRPVHRDVRGVE